MLDKSKIELITIGIIIFVLILGVIFAAKPGRLLKEARNATRINHMETILSALYGYTIDNQGLFPPCIPDSGKGAVDITECAELLPYTYKDRFPADPQPNAKYMIEYLPKIENRIRIFSTAPEAKEVKVIR